MIQVGAPDRHVHPSRDIAVVGMSGLFPGEASSLEAFWRGWVEGASSTSSGVPPFRLVHDGSDAHGAYIQDAEMFDAEFFGMEPHVAARLDPQHRILLQLGWAALEDGGYAPSKLRGIAGGIFLSVALTEYGARVGRAISETGDLTELYPGLAPCRMSDYLDWRGPSELVQSTCVGSLLALHRAVKALRAGECDVALAGAANLLLSRETTRAFEDAGMLSSGSTCYLFDERGDGYVRGEGAAVVMLKRVGDAVRDGDQIYAVIKGTSVRHSGRSPTVHSLSLDGQRSVATAACDDAHLSADTIRFLMMQGTGKLRSDRREIEAVLGGWAGSGTAEQEAPTRRWLGCLKPGFGHLETVGGMAALIAMAMAFRHGVFPALRGAEMGHPKLDLLEEFQLEVDGCGDLAELRGSRAAEEPLRAAIHGFGLGGVNAHLILEDPSGLEAAREEITLSECGKSVFVFSARTLAALRATVSRVREFLMEAPPRGLTSMLDVATTLQLGRDAMEYRYAVACTTCDELIAHLATYLETEERVERENRGVRERFSASDLGGDEADQEFFSTLWASGKLERVAKLWEHGATVDWNKLPGAGRGRRISLPTYAFARDRQWIDGADGSTPPAGSDGRVIEENKEEGPASGDLVEEFRRMLPQPGTELNGEWLDITFSTLGLTSLDAIKLQSRLAQKYRPKVPLKLLLHDATPRQIIGYLNGGEAWEPKKLTVEAAPKKVEDDRYKPFPLTEMQLAYYLGRVETRALSGNGCHLYWEFERPEWNCVRLQCAWQQLIGRHEMLRAVFDADATQRVLPVVPNYRIEVRDLRESEAQAAADALLEVRSRFSHQRFDVGTWPLFALALTILPGSMRLHFGIDLLIADARSVLLLLRELRLLYDDPEARLAPISTSFRAFVTSSQRLPTREPDETTTAYWRDKASMMPCAPLLPQLRSAACLERAQFVRYDRRMSAHTWKGLGEKARRHGVTMATAVLTAFADVMRMWQKDGGFTLNVTTASRAQWLAGIDDIFGDFTSNVLLSCRPDEAVGFGVRAERLGALLLEDLDHAAVSGMQALRLRGQRQGENAFMPVVFTSLLGHRDGMGDPLTLDCPGKFVAGMTETSQVWLDAQVAELDRGLYLSWDVVDELFPAGLLKEMFECFADLVDRLATDEDCWSEARPVRLPDAQLARRTKANATHVRELPELLHEGFLKQAAENPDAIAIFEEDVLLSYGEVLARAAGIAERLMESCCEPGQLIGLVAAKSATQVVGCLGILMAGAAYLPIDVNLPAARIRELLSLGDCRIALVQGHLVPHGLRPLEGCLFLDMAEIPPAGSETQRWRRASPDGIAYVIFTSGSTGVPKGVTIRHRSAANTVRDINQRFAVRASDRVLALSSLSFDLSVYDLFGSLAAGAAIVLPDPARVVDPEYLSALLESARVSVWNSVPSYLHLFIEGGARSAAELRLILLSGDWIPVALPSRARKCFPNAELISLGGATEASIWSIFHPIGEIAADAKSILYGKPLANQRFYVLDADWNPCPDWVDGELYIAGEGLAVGYWRDQARTKDAFPIHPVTGERLYRTGDWGRYIADGDIEFLGRRDLQVKIGGHRVELGEVAAVLSRCPGVREAVAFTIDDQWQQKRLAAAIVNDGVTSLTALELRRSMSSQVADYLVPQEFLFLERLPLTSTGKVDRRALEEAVQRDAMLNLDSTRSLLAELEGPDTLKDVAERRRFAAELNGLRAEPSEVSISLPSGVDDEFSDRYSRYCSTRHFTWETVSKEALAALLSCLRGVVTEDKPKYLFPSAGDAYCVQTYVHVQEARVSGIRPGFYYFHPLGNQLHLIDLELDPTELHLPANRAIAGRAAFSLYFMADLRAIRPLYGAAGEHLCRLEAGHMGQLLRETAAEIGLGLCPVGYLPVTELRRSLSLSEECVLLYSFLAGAPGETLRIEACNILKEDRQTSSRVERLIAEAWSEILEQESVFPLDANLFELGGNSFAALKLHRVLTQRAGLSLSVTDLFRYPTVRSLAAHVNSTKEGVGASPVLVHAAKPEPLPASRRQLRRSIRERVWKGETA